MASSPAVFQAEGSAPQYLLFSRRSTSSCRTSAEYILSTTTIPVTRTIRKTQSAPPGRCKWNHEVQFLPTTSVEGTDLPVTLARPACSFQPHSVKKLASEDLVDRGFAFFSKLYFKRSTLPRLYSTKNHQSGFLTGTSTKTPIKSTICFHDDQQVAVPKESNSKTINSLKRSSDISVCSRTKNIIEKKGTYSVDDSVTVECDACKFCDDVCNFDECICCQQKRDRNPQKFAALQTWTTIRKQMEAQIGHSLVDMFASCNLEATQVDAETNFLWKNSLWNACKRLAMGFRCCRSPQYTQCEVGRHVAAGAMWLTAHNKVYDATALLPVHPGGAQCILNRVGQDCSVDFDLHSAVARRQIWQRYCLGNLVQCRADHRRSTQTCRLM